MKQVFEWTSVGKSSRDNHWNKPKEPSDLELWVLSCLDIADWAMRWRKKNRRHKIEFGRRSKP